MVKPLVKKPPFQKLKNLPPHHIKKKSPYIKKKLWHLRMLSRRRRFKRRFLTLFNLTTHFLGASKRSSPLFPHPVFDIERRGHILFPRTPRPRFRRGRRYRLSGKIPSIRNIFCNGSHHRYSLFFRGKGGSKEGAYKLQDVVEMPSPPIARYTMNTSDKEKRASALSHSPITRNNRHNSQLSNSPVMQRTSSGKALTVRGGAINEGGRVNSLPVLGGGSAGNPQMMSSSALKLDYGKTQGADLDVGHLIKVVAEQVKDMAMDEIKGAIPGVGDVVNIAIPDELKI